MGAGAPLPCVRCGKEATLRCPKCIEVTRALRLIHREQSEPFWPWEPLSTAWVGRCRGAAVAWTANRPPLLISVQVCIPEEKSSFCSQECFKGGWAEHKGVHTDPTQAWLYWRASQGRPCASFSMPFVP